MLLLVLFYMVGIAGLLHPATTLLFHQLVPFNILLSLIVLFYFHHKWYQQAILSMLMIVIAGFLIELAGIHTGNIFGKYHYGNSLGWKLSDTPLIIGLNWLLLVYITHVAVRKIGIGKPWIELTAAALMTALDYLIEPVAMKYDFWDWDSGAAPVQNFAAWFYLSFFMQLFFNRVKPVQENEMAIPLLILQILFFAALNIW